MLAYILGNAYVLSYKRDMFYPYNAIPVILMVVYAAIFHLQKLVFFLAFCTPLAITLKELGLSNGMDLSLPSEPLMAGIMLLYIFNELSSRITDKNFINHPITTLIVVQLAWMFFTTLTSTEVLISLKYLISRLWFIFSCYIIMLHIFQNKKKHNKFYFLLFFSISYCCVLYYLPA